MAVTKPSTTKSCSDVLTQRRNRRTMEGYEKAAQ